MKKITLILLTISFCGLTACKTGTKKGGDMDKETLVKIETTLGDIEVKLYNETPKHRDNFIKLVKDGVYEGTLFHRVIKDFMIQAGDPDSKNAPKGKMLGTGDVGYTTGNSPITFFISTLKTRNKRCRSFTFIITPVSVFRKQRKCHIYVTSLISTLSVQRKIKTITRQESQTGRIRINTVNINGSTTC